MSETATITVPLQAVEHIADAVKLYACLQMGRTDAITRLAERGALKVRLRNGTARALDDEEVERLTDNAEGIAECLGMDPGQSFVAGDRGLPAAAGHAWRLWRALDMAMRPDTLPPPAAQRADAALELALNDPLPGQAFPTVRLGGVWEKPARPPSPRQPRRRGGETVAPPDDGDPAPEPPRPVVVEALPPEVPLVMFDCAPLSTRLSEKGCAGLYRASQGDGAGPSGLARDACRGCATGRAHARRLG